MTSKKAAGSNVVKLSLMICEPPSILFSARTNQYHFETLNEPLHLPPPTPHFVERKNKVANSGVPIYLIASLTNTRFQQIRDVQLSVGIWNNGRKISDKIQMEVPKPQNLAPQKWCTLPLVISCPTDGTMTVQTAADVTFENQKMRPTQTFNVSIYKSVHVHTEIKDSIMQLKVENQMKDTLLLNVKMRTPDKVIRNLARFLRFEELVSKIVSIENPFDRFEISWSLPFAHKCFLTLGVNQQTPEKNKKQNIEVNILDVPQAIAALKQFILTVEIKNLADKAISGNFAFKKADQNLNFVGKNSSIFENIEPGASQQIQLHCIALIPGSFSIPEVQLKLDGSNDSLVFESNKGILVIGHDDWQASD